MKITNVKNYEIMSRMAANIISAQIIMKPDSVIGLATGSTPVGTYSQLAKWYKKGDLDFSQVRSVNLDEYVGLAANDKNSFRYFMNENLFYNVNIDMKNTFVPNGMAKNLQQECLGYDANIDALGGIDLQLLGIGHNGHIGFNEPDNYFIRSTHVVDLQEKTINANSRFFSSPDEVPRQAITMGFASIMKAKRILLIANGQDKKKIIEKAITGPITPKIPASILQLHPDVTVIYSEE